MAKRVRTRRATRSSEPTDSTYPTAGVKAPPVSEKAWRELKSALASVLSELDEDEYLVIQHKSDGSFVQFAAQGAHGMRAEAVSNAYLPETSQLSSSACEDLVKLGWNAPTYVQVEGVAEPADGSSNFYVDAATPVPHSKLSALAVESLRRVYLVRHPGELEYAAHDREATPIRFPLLKLKRRRSEPAPAAVQTSSAPAQSTWAEWKVVVDPTDSAVVICDQAEILVARVYGQSEQEVFARALLIARAPALRDATVGALQVLSLIADRDTGSAGAAAREIIPAIEASLVGAVDRGRHLH